MASPDLYDALEVLPNADATAIKAAWKKAMKRVHPDMPGGSREAFDLAQTAMMVLSDPKQRARYDRTGEYDAEPEPDNETAKVLDLLARALDSIVDDVEIDDALIKQRDMVAGLRFMIGNGRSHTLKQMAENERLKARWEGVLGRFQGEHARLVEAMVKRRISQYDEAIEKGREQIAGFDQVEEMLAGLTFKVDTAPAWMGGMYDPATQMARSKRR